MTTTVCFPFVGDSVGGSHISALLLIEGLEPKQFSPLIVLHRDGPLAEHLKARKLSFELLPLDRFAGAQPSLSDIATSAARAIVPLRRFIREHCVSIVHTNDLRMNLTWALAARSAGAKLLWHQRTMPNSTSSLWRLVPRLATEAIAISQAVAAATSLTQAQVVYNPFGSGGPTPIDRQAASTDLRRRLDLKPDSHIIGFVGRLVASKRADICLEMIPRLEQQLGRAVHCVFAGRDPGSAESDLRALAADRNVLDRCHFLGFQYPIEPIVAGIDLLVAPSLSEGFGRSLVESMLVGTPVLASAIPAHLEIIRNPGVGFTFPPGDIGMATATAAEILADPARARRIADTAQADAGSRFTREAHVLSIQAVYERMLTPVPRSWAP